MDYQDYPEWHQKLAELSGSTGTIMLLGDTDTGKSTFMALLSRLAIGAGRRVALIDGDIGQSNIGPPACVSLAYPDSAEASISSLSPSSMAFVGSSSPRGRLLAHCSAVGATVRLARSGNADLAIVDTTGYVKGSVARDLKLTKITLISPEHIVALQRGSECEHILKSHTHSDLIQIHRLAVPASITTKSPAMRAQRRAGRFARYFQNSELLAVGFEQAAITGSWLNTGKPLAPHLLQYLSYSLGVRVYYGEELDRHLGLVTDALPDPERSLSPLHEQFHPEAITITPVSRLRHLLVGLHDHNNKMLGLGLIEWMRFTARQIGIMTPVRSQAAIRVVACGIMRLQADGVELGFNKPGDI